MKDIKASLKSKEIHITSTTEEWSLFDLHLSLSDILVTLWAKDSYSPYITHATKFHNLNIFCFHINLKIKTRPILAWRPYINSYISIQEYEQTISVGYSVCDTKHITHHWYENFRHMCLFVKKCKERNSLRF